MRILLALLLSLLIGCTNNDLSQDRPGPYEEHSHHRRHRSAAARAAFKRQHPCPATGQPRGACPGWIIDHVKALACGGDDDPSNMQWQTVDEAKAKDKWELKQPGCPGY